MSGGKYVAWYSTDGETCLAEFYGDAKGDQPNGIGFKVRRRRCSTRAGEPCSGSVSREREALPPRRSSMAPQVWANGSSYHGEWSSGMEHTLRPGHRGTYRWPDGRVYVGTFLKAGRPKPSLHAAANL